MRCAKCGADNREAARFCDKCGARLPPKCASCGAENRIDAKFCDSCGAALGADAAVAALAAKPNNTPIRGTETSAAENLDGERKTVTVLFADIKGSMDLIEDLDPEEARAIVEPALKLMMEAVHHYGGYVAQSTGDGIFALFGAPIAHEDHPQRALLAALRMQQELKRYSGRTRTEGRLPIQVRVGMNTGEVVARTINTGEGHTEYVPIGHSVSLAARMQALAPIGSIAATEQVRKLCEGYFAFTPLGPTKVKGVSEPVNVHEVTGLGPLRTRLQRAAARGYTKFVGREREMEALKHAAELAKTGHGQIVAAVAEPGVGKSRLFFEFKATCQSSWLALEGLSFPHGKTSPYLPLIELLHDYFGIHHDDEPLRRREKVAGKVAMLDRSLEETLPHLFALLGIVEGVDPLAGMDEQIRRRRTQEAVKRILLRESLKQPLTLIFEDLHWLDVETQGFLNLLAEGVANAPVLLLVNYRPEYRHEWGSRSHYSQLRLDPLGRESAEEMLSVLLSDNKEITLLKGLIIERTEGNPLFIEEVVEALFDDGALVRNGTVKVTRPLSQLNIPPTVQGILAARIDRLPPEAKELLQTLAVIGSEFPLVLVRQVARLPAERLDPLLDVLQEGEFIYEQPATGDVEYFFKHALTHDAAYKSLLTERRKLLHERTAETIEALYPDRLEDHYADLAHHYRSSDNTPKAIEYLRLAGERAVNRGTYAQALANVEAALKLVERLPERVEQHRAELGVRLLEGMAVSALYGMASTERLRAFKRVWELSEQLGDGSAEVQGRLNVAGVYLSRAVDIPLALEIVRSCADLAQQSRGGALRPVVHLQLAILLYNAGDPVQASSLFDELMMHFEPACHEAGTDYLAINAWVLTPAVFCLVQQALGRLDQALRLSEQALRRAHQLTHPFSLSAAYAIAARLRCQRREPAAAREMAEAAIALAEEHGFGNWLGLVRSIRGWLLVENGQTEKGIGELETNAPLALANFQIQVYELLAEAYLRVGRLNHAADTLGERLAKCERSGMHIDEAELHRLTGEVILARDASATAEAGGYFSKAIKIARGQSAKWYELLATVSLTRLLAERGKRDEARAMLAGIYSWFTEGFDTADLKDAKALLDELSS